MSPQIEAWTGLPAEHFLGDLEPWYALIHPDDRQAVEDRASSAHGAGQAFAAEYRLRTAQGGWRRVLDREVVVDDLDGRRATLGVMTDVSALRALEQAEEQLRGVVAHAPMVVVALDADGRVTMMEGSRVAALGPGLSDLVGAVLWDALPEDHRIVVTCRRALAGESFREVVQAGELWFDTYYQALPDGGIMGVATEVTERERSERAIAHRAYHDPLTGLPNRPNLEDQLARSLARARRTGATLALLSIDLDDFRLVNDVLGHPAGDALLRRLTRRLLGVLRDGDLLTRQGGDEFVLLLDELHGPPLETAQRVAAKLLDALDEPFELEDDELHVGASIGISVFPEHGTDADELLKHTAGSRSTPACAARCATASSCCTSSRSPASRRACSRATRRSSAGRTPTRASCPRARSSSTPRSRGASTRSAPGRSTRRAVSCARGRTWASGRSSASTSRPGSCKPGRTLPILRELRDLGMNTVAEGVETEEQRRFLARHGCCLAQGFHLGRPMPAEEATRRLLEPRLRAVAA
jgi:diguanylate cyclase (GGDEF)-like protein